MEDGVRFAIHERRVHKGFRRAGRIGSDRTSFEIVVREGRLQSLSRERCGGAWDRDCSVWTKGSRACLRESRHRRKEPGTVVPAAKRIGSAQISRVLVGRVDVRQPQVSVTIHALQSSAAPNPGWILGGELRNRRHECFVLDNQGNQVSKISGRKGGNRAGN
jgi:hypothetical protein